MTMRFGSCSAGWFMVAAAMAISVIPRRIHGKGAPEEACLKAEEEQANDETRGIHDFNVCQLYTDLDVPVEDKRDRRCTAHLALIEGKGLAVAPATCFVPDKPEKFGVHLKNVENLGWAFNGKVFLTCGPLFETFIIQSTFENPVALLHPEFDPTKKFAQLHNIAVIRISKDIFAQTTKAADWEFARLSVPPAAEPAVGSKCRCYAGVFETSKQTEPQEYQTEVCKFPEDTPAEIKGNVCLRLSQSDTIAAAMSARCTAEYCGMKQSMSCFCGSTADELKKLHSAGSFFWKQDKEQIFMFSVPVKSNWHFLTSFVDKGPELGATDAQLEAVKKELSDSMDKCLKSTKGEAAKSFVKKYLCDGKFEEEMAAMKKDQATGKIKNLEKFQTSLKEFSECMQVDELTPRQTESCKGELLIPPVEQVLGMAYRVADEKVCAKAKPTVTDALRRLRKGLRRRMRCFSLVFRNNFKEKSLMNGKCTFQKISENGAMLTFAGAASGVVPAAIGAVIGIGCTEINGRYAKLRLTCFAISTMFLTPMGLVDLLATSLIMAPDAVVAGAMAALPAAKAAAKLPK